MLSTRFEGTACKPSSIFSNFCSTVPHLSPCPVGTKCVSDHGITYLELEQSSTCEHLKFGYSLSFPADRAFHVQCSEVFLFLAIAALRARRQIEPKALNCRCPWNLCGREASALPWQVGGIQGGREFGKQGCPMSPEMHQV